MSVNYNLIEYKDYRYYLFPEQLDWVFQKAEGPLLNKLSPVNRSVNYDFARNEFDHLLICVTNRCNITCDYCFRGFNFSEKDEFSLKEFKQVADHFEKKAKFKPTFQFTGGEVFIKKDIEQMFQYVHDKGFRIWLTSNGVSPLIQNSKIIRDIFSNNRKAHIRISCDGHIPELYEKHRGQAGTFKKVEENLKYLVSIGVPTTIKSVITPDNFPYLEEMLEWAYELGIIGWNYNVLRYTGAMAENPPEDATCKSKESISYVGYYELGKKLTDIVRRKPHLGSLLGISRYGKILDTLYSSNPHGVHMIYYTLNYNGEVYVNDNLYQNNYSRGNIFKDGMNAFNGLESIRDNFDSDLPCCKKCNIHKFCFQKGDYGELFDKSTELETEFPNCDDLRKHFYEMLSLRNEGSEIAATVNLPELKKFIY